MQKLSISTSVTRGFEYYFSTNMIGRAVGETFPPIAQAVKVKAISSGPAFRKLKLLVVSTELVQFPDQKLVDSRHSFGRDVVVLQQVQKVIDVRTRHEVVHGRLLRFSGSTLLPYRCEKRVTFWMKIYRPEAIPGLEGSDDLQEIN
jgi:hypothetical protein